MDQNNNINTYNQVTPMAPSHNYSSVSQKQDNMKRLLLLIGAIFVAVLIFVLVVVMLMNLRRSNDVQFKKTAMMTLYEQLDEKMTYEDLQAKIDEVVPGASIIYDEDMYIIGFVDYNDGEDDEDDMDNEDEMSDYITCNIEMADVDKEEDDVVSDDGDLEDEEVEEPTEVVNFDTLVEDIMAEDDSELDDEDDDDIEGEDDDDIEGEVGIDNVSITPQTVMTYFVYNSGAIIGSRDDDSHAELYVQKVDNGYGLYNGKEETVLPTKVEAIDTLLKTLNGQI